MKYGDLTLGQVEAIVNKLGGMDAVERFLRNELTVQKQEEGFFRLVNGEVAIQIPALKRPTLEALQAKWSWIARIERDTSPEAAVLMRLATVLTDADGGFIAGDVYERRLAPRLKICLGFQQAQWLVEHQDEHPAFKALLGMVYIDFAGLVVVGAGGHRYVPYLHDDGRRFVIYWSNLAGGFDDDGRIAVSSKQ